MKTKLATLAALAFVATASAFYNAEVGRWLSRDPIGERGGENLFAFVHNHPPISFDALGLQCCLTTVSPGTFSKPDGTPDSSAFGHSFLKCDNGAYVSLWEAPYGWVNEKWDADTYQNATKSTICFPCLDEKKSKSGSMQTNPHMFGNSRRRVLMQRSPLSPLDSPTTRSLVVPAREEHTCTQGTFSKKPDREQHRSSRCRQTPNADFRLL
jgi:hypothetical protein